MHHEAVAKVVASDDYIGAGDRFDPTLCPVVDDVDLLKCLEDLIKVCLRCPIFEHHQILGGENELLILDVHC